MFSGQIDNALLHHIVKGFWYLINLMTLVTVKGDWVICYVIASASMCINYYRNITD